MDLGGVPALVAGGASGLGAATARRLAAAGASVAVLDRDGERAGAVATEVGGLALVADVADAQGVERALAAAEEAHGPLRVLVTCAGVGAGRQTVRSSGPHDLELFERVVRVNLVGTFNCVRLAAWAMSRQEPLGDDGERGVIVTTSSIAAYDGVDGGVAYSASKAGVAGMTLPLARDLAPHGVRVVSIAPGSFATPMNASLPPSYGAALEDATPFPGRFGRPEEFADLVAHAVANPMLNGEVIRLDGGLRMAPSRPFRAR